MKYNAFISYSHSQDTWLTPAIEEALEKFAKPTFKRRALEIFRDSNDLSISPDLWGKIAQGLDESEYFICFACPAHAKSFYCDKEVKHWLETKGVENFLIVLTHGELHWDHDKNDFDWTKTTAVSKTLSGVFENSPLYVDFRGDFKESELTLDNPEFKDRLVYIAATLHGKPVGDMVGEAIKQHKRTLRIRNAAVLTVMTLMALSLALLIVSNRRKDASLLHFQAQSEKFKNPTVALRLEEEALKIYDFPDFEKSALEIIGNNGFYRILKSEDSVFYTSIHVNKTSAHLLLGGSDGRVSILNENGQFIASLASNKGKILSLDSSGDGDKLLIGSENGAQLWTNSGNLVTGFRTGEEELYLVQDIKFAPGDTILATASASGAHIWDLNADLQTEILPGSRITALEFFADGRAILVAAEGAKEVAAAYDMDGNYLFSLQNYGLSFGEAYNHTNSILASPDGRYILTASFDNSSALWDGAGNLLKIFNNPIIGNDSKMKARFSPDGRYVLAGSSAGEILVWDLKANKIKTLQGHRLEILDINFSADGEYLFSISADRSLRKWRLNGIESEILQQFETENRISEICLSRDGMTIYTASSSTGIQVWSPAGDQITQFNSQSGKISVLQLGASNEILFSGSSDGELGSWDLNSGVYSKFDRHPAPIIAVKQLTADGSIISVSDDGLVRFSSRTGETLKEFSVGTQESSGTLTKNQVAIARDGSNILTAAHHYIDLWDNKGTLLRSFELPGTSVLRSTKSLAFSPDGKTFLSGSTDGMARLWDLEGNLLSVFQGPGESANMVGFAPDGQTLLTVFGSMFDFVGPNTGKARIWDLEGNLLSEFNFKGRSPDVVVFAGDNRSILAGYGSNMVQHSLVPPDEYLNTFLDRYVEPLSESQREAFSID